LKWFHSSKKGFVSGFVTGGFCLAAVYLAPIATAFLARFSIEISMKLMGVLLLTTSLIIARFIKNPPTGYVPEKPKNFKAKKFISTFRDNLSSREIIRTPHFKLMFFIFLINVSVGLMVIGNIASIAYYQAKIVDYNVLAFLLSLMAVMNFLGRLVGGIISDRLGRVNTLFVVMVLQMINIAAFRYYNVVPELIFGVIIAGFCFGAVLSIFPAFTADLFGLKNHGANYGLIFLAYGASGVFAPLIADYFYDAYRSFSIPYMVCASMLLAAIVANYALKKVINKHSVKKE